METENCMMRGDRELILPLDRLLSSGLISWTTV